MAEKIERFGSAFAPATRSCRPKTTTTGSLQRRSWSGQAHRPDDGVLIADFDGREIEYPFGELDSLVPAYATTIHKSQGRNTPRGDHAGETALHHARQKPGLYGRHPRKRLVVIVGQRKALAIAVRSHGSRRRWTKLREWLTGNGRQDDRRQTLSFENDFRLNSAPEIEVCAKNVAKRNQRRPSAVTRLFDSRADASLRSDA